jgi:hypothetical protein
MDKRRRLRTFEASELIRKKLEKITTSNEKSNK